MVIPLSKKVGGYGGTNRASKNGNPGDFNIDKVVNFEDYCELSSEWSAAGNFIVDLVGFVDVHLFFAEWLRRQE